MPRARTTESDDVVVVKKPRASRARTVSADGAPVPRKRAPRKKVAPKPAPEPVAVVESESTPQRKAPTSIAADRKRSARRSVGMYIVGTICLLLIVSGVVVGLFDHGQIDVVTIVTTRNEKIARGEVLDQNGQPITVAVPVQVDNRPNGGLTKADPALIPSTPPTTPTSSVETTASTTPDGTATSTDIKTTAATSSEAQSAP